MMERVTADSLNVGDRVMGDYGRIFTVQDVRQNYEAGSVDITWHTGKRVSVPPCEIFYEVVHD